MVVALADVVFDYYHIFVCVFVDVVVVAGLAVVFVLVSVNDSGVPPVIHVDA